MEHARLPKRFELVRQLGRGGMGVVYEAVDRELGGRVAIKTIRDATAETIARFKREFRALQDVRHPNLVTLGELFCEDGHWAFSMGLIEKGVDFVTYARGARSASERASDGPQIDLASTIQDVNEVPASSGLDVLRRPTLEPGEAGPIFDPERLRSSLVQLASGLDALHDANRVHRDIKPSNVMVGPSGHVTILDFGLVTEVDREHSHELAVVGTPHYMSPEQAAATASLGPPSDWYSVGVMLYLVLTGRFPFDGKALHVLMTKQTSAPRAPRLVAPSVPEGLDALCMRLLAIDPRERPAGRDVSRALVSADRASDRLMVHRSSSTTERTFVGRSDEIDQLAHAFKGTLDGNAGCVLVEGESGIGKSYLIDHFIGRMRREHPELVVLSGRCYENESVPYKAFDAVVDSLVRHLMAMPRAEAAVFLPSQLAALMQTFPAFQRVEAAARQVRVVSSKMGPLEIRSRAFSALRELFDRIAQRVPLVVMIDDLQWSDRDSMGLLAEIVREPEPPPILLLATARPKSEANTQGADFRAVLPRRRTTLSLSRLPDSQATELATRLLESAAPDRLQSAATIAEEAGGHALFIAELVHYGAAQAPGTHRKLRLEDLVLARVGQLDAPAQRLLTLLCVAGTPMPAVVLGRAATVPPGALAGVLSDLRAAHFIRTATIDGFDSVEPYHDRIRHVVLGTLDAPGRAGAYEQLAFALQGSKHADAKTLAELWRGAGDLERAGEHALLAGHQAAEALAFDRAATYYQWALERPSCAGSDRQELTVLVAETLAKGGRGAQAAAVFQRAAEHAEPTEALDLERRAADQLLRVGHFDAGLAAVQRIVARVGLGWPKSPLAALITFVLLRIWRTVRGYGYRKRDPMHAAAGERLGLDVCWTVATGLGMCDNIRAAVFQQRYVSLALRSGDARRISLALSYECAFRGGYGGAAGWPTTARFVTRAIALAEQTGDPFCRGFAPICIGSGMMMSARFREALEPLERGQALLRSDCPGATWELVSQQLFTSSALFWLGEGRVLLEKQPVYLREATERGDVYGLVQMSIGLANFVWLLQDDPAAARERARDAMGRWSNWGYRVEDYLALFARTNADLYEGVTEAPLRSVNADWASLERSMLRRLPLIRVTTSHLRGRTRLAHAEASPKDRAVLLRDVEADARALGRQGTAWASGLGEILLAGAAAVRGDDAATEARLRRSVALLVEADVHLFAAVARRTLGRLVKGDEGSALAAQGETFMRAQRVQNVPAVARCLMPGFGRLE